MKTSIIINLLLLIIIILVILIVIYLNSGSCKTDKNYICNDKFCLYKEFKINLKDNIKKDINKMLDNKEIQKRVNLKSPLENIYNCALPNKRGVTINTQQIINNHPDLINFYQNELCKIVSNQIGLELLPTDLTYPTSCAFLIYEEEGDWINWHYDYNYYDGRFFTLLIPITSDLTCTKFQFKNNKNEVKTINLTENSICFEGNYLYHRATKLCKNEKRVVLSCQYVTNNNMNLFNKIRIKLKDYTYVGKLF